jgi:hypothetical protein
MGWSQNLFRGGGQPHWMPTGATRRSLAPWRTPDRLDSGHWTLTDVFERGLPARCGVQIGVRIGEFSSSALGLVVSGPGERSTSSAINRFSPRRVRREEAATRRVPAPGVPGKPRTASVSLGSDSEDLAGHDVRGRSLC